MSVKRLGIGEAVHALKAGNQVLRESWNGKGMYLELFSPDGGPSVDFVMLRNARGHYVPWTCSQEDLLATDWRLA